MVLVFKQSFDVQRVDNDSVKIDLSNMRLKGLKRFAVRSEQKIAHKCVRYTKFLRFVDRRFEPRRILTLRTFEKSERSNYTPPVFDGAWKQYIDIFGKPQESVDSNGESAHQNIVNALDVKPLQQRR